MSDPELYTAAQASDPATPAQTLADIAALRADLRPLVAANPSTYPGLLEWLGGLGDPTVDAALTARTAASAEPTQVLPTAPPAPSWAAPPETPAAPGWQGQAQTPPDQPYQAPGQPYQTPGQPYQAPGQPYQGPGQPYQSPGYAAPQGQPYAGTGYAGTPPKKGGSKVGLVLGIVFGVILLIGIGGFFALKSLFNRADNVLDDAMSSFSVTLDTDTGTDTDISEGQTYGDDAALDALWDSCAGGDYQACDDLYFEAPIGSEYEEFGRTCGNMTDGSSSCVAELGGEESDFGGETPQAYGDDTMLDYLWDQCQAEDWTSCDDLYFRAPIGSDYEEFGRTCGTRTEGSDYCIVELGGGSAPEDIPDDATAYGSNATLDALWDACEAGDLKACDDLYFLSPTGSEYEAFGDTCGERTDGGAYCFPY